VTTYGIFSRGHFVGAYRSETKALRHVAEILDDKDTDPEAIWVTVFERGLTKRTIAGDELRAATAEHGERTGRKRSVGRRVVLPAMI
jgi:hypothetical protein